jgi:Raf kinase inhibitor-like YbhB/YbcL family protein
MSIKRNRFVIVFGLLLLITATISGCQSETVITPVDTEPPPKALEATQEVEQLVTEVIESPEPILDLPEFTLSSAAFLEDEAIPTKYSCDGDDISPSLVWSGAPENTGSFVLIMDDPDAPVGTWVHWVLFNLPGDANSLPENLPANAAFTDGSQQGSNSWGNIGYGGPCPPIGTHRYFFKLYALESSLELVEGATKEDVISAMEDYILMETELMGTYSASGG